MTPGTILRLWREANGIRHEHVAVIAEVSFDTARNWENDKGHGPGVAHLRRLEAAHPGLLAALFGKPAVDEPPAEGAAS